MNLIEEYKANFHKDRKTFVRMIEERTVLFAVKIIRFSGNLPDTPEGAVIKNELTKAGTSIGAFFSEANMARSRMDYGDKIKICESASGRTVYWLTIVSHLKWVAPKEMEEELQEANEFLSLFRTIGKATNESTKK